MEEVNSNQTGDELEQGDSNLDGDESDTEISLEELFGDDESDDKAEKEQSFLETYNKAFGTTFKTIEAAQKSNKELVTKLTNKGREEKAVKDTTTKTDKVEEQNRTVEIPAVVKSLYFGAKPEAKLVWAEVEKAAKLTGRDAFELYESEPFFQEKAKSLYNEEEEQEDGKRKVKNPSFTSGGKSGGSKMNLSAADRALLARRGLKESDVKSSN
jgi:hypothetical protein